jgi:hypothetical protein
MRSALPGLTSRTRRRRISRLDLQENDTVTVTGRQPDGSLKANSITTVPAGSAGFGGGGAPNGG